MSESFHPQLDLESAVLVTMSRLKDVPDEPVALSLPVSSGTEVQDAIRQLRTKAQELHMTISVTSAPYPDDERAPKGVYLLVRNINH
jgi:hypothetical protein